MLPIGNIKKLPIGNNMKIESVDNVDRVVGECRVSPREHDEGKENIRSRIANESTTAPGRSERQNFVLSQDKLSLHE
jgi:hypothetical protein